MTDSSLHRPDADIIHSELWSLKKMRKKDAGQDDLKSRNVEGRDGNGRKD